MSGTTRCDLCDTYLRVIVDIGGPTRRLIRRYVDDNISEKDIVREW